MSEAALTLPMRPLSGYWTESRRPLVSLVFIAPLLACYEAGVLLLHVQNGADAWMRGWLHLLGFGPHFLLPLLTIAILLGWHHVSGQPWRFSSGVLAGMALESMAMAVLLWLIWRVQAEFWTWAMHSTTSIGERLSTWVGFLGAGIYEELLFRVILLSLALWLLSLTRLQRFARLAIAIVATSLLFSAAHYVRIGGVVGDPFHWSTFSFRFIAGVFFSLLYVYRGFGIAACAHAAYNIFVAPSP